MASGKLTYGSDEDEVQFLSQTSSSSSQEQFCSDQKNELVQELCKVIIELPEGNKNGTISLSDQKIWKLQSLCEEIMSSSDARRASTSGALVTYFSVSDSFHSPEKSGKQYLPSKSPKFKSSPQKQPFTREECICLLDTVLRYLDDNKFNMDEIVEYVRNKHWEKPFQNSLLTQFNAGKEEEEKRCGESLKSKFKSLTGNRDTLMDLLKCAETVEKFIALRERYDSITSCARRN